MKRSYRFLFATLLAGATALPAMAGNGKKMQASPEDTILVKLANDARMTLYLKDSQQLKSFQSYSLDSLMLLLNQYVSQVENASKNANAKTMSLTFNPAQETNNPKAPEQVTVTLTDRNAGRSATNMEVGKAMKIQVEYDSAGTTSKITMSIAADKNNAGETDKKETPKKTKAYKATTSDFDIDLGLNVFANQGKYLNPPTGEEINYDLRPIGSRYLALTFRRNTQVGGAKSPFHLQYGIGFAFNNYMFEKDIQLLDIEDRVVFQKHETSLDKSKLAVVSAELPVTAVLQFTNKKGKDSFQIGAGGFAGYRLSSHTKVKYEFEDRTRKDKEKGNYNLEDFQYGLNFQVGYGSVVLFGKYHLNDLFKENRGPEVNVLGFGIRI